MRHILLFSVFIFLLESCVTNNHHPFVQINFDYRTGFRADTLTLYTSRQKFSALMDSLNMPLDFYEELLETKNFRNLFEHSNLYFNNVIAYLADSSKPNDRKFIAVLTMLRRDYAKNLNLLYACNYFYKLNLITEDVIFEILFPRLDLRNRDIIKYYKSEQVQRVLKDIRNNSRTSLEFKNTIENILSGKAYQEQKEFLSGQYNIEI